MIWAVVVTVAPAVCVHAQDCPPVKLTDFPPADLPASLDTGQLHGEESSKYYYGIGVPVDYARARRMAFVEFAAGKNYEFCGAEVLLMLYANGFGVKRDLDLSIRLACGNVNGAGAEVEGRDVHLKALRSGDRLYFKSDTFDICDDITSGLMEGMCAGLVSEKEQAKRKAQLDSILSRWSAADLVAFRHLRAAATDYFETRSAYEVDLRGTARAALEIGESESLEVDFLDEIKHANSCNFASSSQQDFDDADKNLNTTYRKLMRTWRDQPHGGIEKSGIKSAQLAWLAYRDAWVEFVRVRCPSVTPETIKTMLTKQRVQQLEELEEENE